MSMKATGTFTVTFEALHTDEAGLGRMRVIKKLAGDLVADGTAEMLSVGTPVEGSAAYVAIDRITGTLHGRSGSFVLQHTGLMDRGEGTLRVVVVPDSGTDELLGLSGDVDIVNADGDHSYTFTYTLDPV
jgi:hypothetical protein